MSAEKSKKLKFKLPQACALLFLLTCFAAVLTWIIPSGEYAREGGRVVANSFHFLDTPHRQGLIAVFDAVTLGFKQQADMINMVLFSGAMVAMLEVTHSLDAILKKAGKFTKGENSEKKVFAILLIITIFMSVGGCAGVFANTVVPLIPVGIMLAKAMGLDAGVGFIVIYLGAYSGFNVGAVNAYTVGIANEIAGLEKFAGMGVRIGLQVINVALTFFFMMMYIKAIKKDYTKSLAYAEGMSYSDVMGEGEEMEGADEKVTIQQILSLLSVVVAVFFIVYGTIKLKWSFAKYATTFLMAAVAIGIINGMGPTAIANGFLKGCAGSLSAGFVIGFAKAIGIVLANGKILDTIVYGLSVPVTAVGAVAGSVFMLLANTVINLFIGSGSGQATAVMPIMAPLAEVSGIARGVAVQAFQFGDGFSNCIYPTAGTLMGCLGLANIPYGKYAKWMLPLFLIQMAVGLVTVVVLQSIGWLV